MKDKKILVIGAGLSTPVLIDYLTEHAISNKWQITVADMDKALAEKRIEGKDRASAVFFDVNDEQMIAGLIPGFDLVISMLPAFLHTKVIEACLEYRIHMITASYNPVNAADYHHIAKERGIIMLNEMGLDPGIDHMSAMELLNKIREKNGQITSFKSSTGGLVAPESDNNPWNYKFSWNPANVVKAGQFGAQFIEDGFYKYIPYHQLFRRTEKIWIEGYGEFETYPNRDSVKYREDYGLKDIPTMYRGTIRRKGYAEAWDALVQLGMTNDVFEMENLADLSYKEFTQSFLPSFSGDLQASLAAYLSLDKQSDTFKKLEWLGLFSDQKTGLTKGTPATVLQQILMSKWALQPKDRDMIVMQHQVGFQTGNVAKKIESTLTVEGKNNQYTAMAMTVGLPVAIGAKRLLDGKIELTGMHIPTSRQIYEPILSELKTLGIQFTEKEMEC